MHKLYVCNLRENAPVGVSKINTTSRGELKGLSPFYCGPIKMYGDLVAKNLENAWQYSKCYNNANFNHVKDGHITDSWRSWSTAGFNATRAERYPAGKGSIPVCSYWDGKFLDYIQARIKIYFPLYRNAVRRQDDWKTLQEMYSNQPLCLEDFDGRRMDLTGESICDIILNENKKMGHAFVLYAMLLYGENIKISELANMENRLQEIKDRLKVPVNLRS